MLEDFTPAPFQCVGIHVMMRRVWTGGRFGNLSGSCTKASIWLWIACIMSTFTALPDAVVRLLIVLTEDIGRAVQTVNVKRLDASTFLRRNVTSKPAHHWDLRHRPRAGK